MKKILPLFLLVFLLSSSLFAGGFQLNEHGARAMAMGGAFTGLANDPSAIYFNPAGITQLKGTQFYLGSTLIAPLGSYTVPGTTKLEYEQKSHVFTPINLYVTQQITDKLHVGLGVNNPFGLGTTWPSNWVGKYLAVDTQLKSFFVTPVVAYQLLDNLSLSVGGIFAWADVKINRKSPSPVGGDFSLTLKGDGTAFGFVAGILYKPLPKLSIGLSYRSEASFDLSGTAESSPATFKHPQLGDVPLPTGDITAPLTTPQNATLGIAYKADDNVTWTADLQYIGWSSYDKLEVTFKNYDLDLNPVNGVQNVSSVPRNYKNTFIVRTGFEYDVTSAFKLRGGIFYDRNPVPTEYVEPTLPDADRIGLNIGYGAKLTENLNLDISYLLLLFSNRDVSNSKFGFNGKYSNTAHLFGVNLHYTL